MVRRGFLTGCVASGSLADVTTASTLVLIAVAPAVVLVGGLAVAYARAAIARLRLREACPFDDDDHEARPLGREIVDVVRESLALARLLLGALLPVPRAWRTLAIAPGTGPVVVLIPARRLSAGTMAPLGRRLARDLGACVHVAPGSASADEELRAARLADHLTTLARAARGRAIVAVGHGDGGFVARRAAAVLRLPDLRVVTLATAHRAAGVTSRRQPPVDRVDVLNVYSLHDPFIVPADRAHLAGAYNVVLRDEGHFGIVLGARPYMILMESLADLLPHAVAS
jgi:hypothetical protein